MSKQWRTALRGVLALSGALMVSTSWGAKPGELRREAEQLVAEALFHESLGLDDDRARLLAEAEQKSPAAANIQWAQGRVKHFGKWVSIDEVPQLMRESAALGRYERKRGDFADTAAGQLALARYCQKQGLDEQTRAHLVRVLDHDTNNAEARRELGFVPIDGKWLHQDDVALANRAAAQRSEDFERWQKRIRDIRHDLTARASAQRTSAAKRLAQIDDPAAIPAIETLLCYDHPEVATKAVEAIGAMTAPEAALALARVSVYTAAEEVREAAGQKLRSRPYEQYVPHLLAALSTLIETRENVSVDANGRLLHQQVMVREGQEQDQVLVRGTEYRRQYVGGGSRSYAEWQAGLDMARQNQDAIERVLVENLSTLERNDRIAKTLSAGTEQSFGADPKAWWNWWNEYNDIKAADGDKPVVVQVALRSVSVLDGVPSSSGGGSGGGGGTATGGGGGGGTGGGGSRPECFVAGTVVRTSTGMTPIEQVRVGDLVLSQDPSSGELAYKPVLKTTITPKGPLVKVEAGNYDSFRCTGGHLFWVSGEGWKQARELRSGMHLHTPRGTLTVSHVAPAPEEQTYNLIVADFHTYFAGARDVLTHDNTLRTPTTTLVPGMAAK